MEPDATTNKLNAVADSLLAIVGKHRDSDAIELSVVLLKRHETPQRQEAVAKECESGRLDFCGVRRIAVRKRTKNPEVGAASQGEQLKCSSMSIRWSSGVANENCRAVWTVVWRLRWLKHIAGISETTEVLPAKPEPCPGNLDISGNQGCDSAEAGTEALSTKGRKVPTSISTLPPLVV
jgi:hypothetical protein